MKNKRIKLEKKSVIYKSLCMKVKNLKVKKKADYQNFKN